MPAGSGKSLCYQLAGIARGGTTLVFATASAAIENQILKMREQNLSVECIHPGVDRENSRRICSEYLHDKLQFLFVDPERLNIAGFPAMLAKRKPSLIAVLDADKVSQKSARFSSDYGLLSATLPDLRPAPIMALTSNSETDVHEEIVQQLHLSKPLRFLP